MLLAPSENTGNDQVINRLKMAVADLLSEELLGFGADVNGDG